MAEPVHERTVKDIVNKGEKRTCLSFFTCLRKSARIDSCESNRSSSSDEISITSEGATDGFCFDFFFVVCAGVRFGDLCGGKDAASVMSGEEVSSRTSGGECCRFEEGFEPMGDVLGWEREAVGEAWARGIVAGEL